MKLGTRVIERRRRGTLLEVYEPTARDTGERLGRKLAVVQFDDDKIPTVGVHLEDLGPA